MSFYDLMGISESGSLLDIKQAYKQLARKYHPDVSPPDRVEEYMKRFIRVQEAYDEVLGMDKLKSELQARGLKCGDTLEERAAILFMLKSTPLDKLPKKLLAKK